MLHSRSGRMRRLSRTSGTSWIRLVQFFAAIAASLSHNPMVGASTFLAADLEDNDFTNEQIERRRYESYVHHGILLGEKHQDPNAKLEGNSNLRLRSLQSASGGSGCNICSLTPNFRGRFGSASFDRDALKLPGKKGVAYTLRSTNWEAHLPRVKFLNPSWNYSWGSKRIDAQPSHIEFVPMVWRGATTEQVQSLIDTDIRPQMKSGNIKRLLGFNEPNVPDQANMDVSSAVELWPQLELIGLPLAGPSVSLQGVGTWMQSWNDAAVSDHLRVDYVAVHWYSAPNVTNFQRFLRHMYDLNGGETPLLLTEFAPADWTATTPSENRFSSSQVLSFMKEVLPWLEAQEWIAGYAWFPFQPSFAAGTSSALFDSYGNPTLLARFYSSVTPDNPSGDQSISF